MTNRNLKTKLASLLFFLIPSNLHGRNASDVPPKASVSNTSKPQGKNTNKKSKDDSIKYNENYAIFTGITVDGTIFEQIKHHKGIDVIIFRNCEITIPLTRVDYSYILDHSNFKNKSDEASGKFIAIQPLDLENGTEVILLQNLLLDENSKNIYDIIKTEFRKRKSEAGLNKPMVGLNKPMVGLNKVSKVIFKNVSFEDDESITDVFVELEAMHKLSKFTDLEIKNSTFNNVNLFKTKLQAFLLNTGVNFTQERSSVVITGSSGSYSGSGLSSNSNMQRTNDDSNGSGLKMSKIELIRILKDVDGIVNDKQFIQHILDSYDFVTKNANSSDYQAKAEAFYNISRINLLAKYPKNLNPSDFRSFRSMDYLKQIIRRLFQKEFPAGLTDFLQKLEHEVVFLIQAKDTSKLTNLLLVGPAGIGKTSLAKVIAMILALAVSTTDVISDDLLDKALVNNDSLEILYEKLLDLSSAHIIDIKGSSISDVNIITGNGRAYTGAEAGIIGKMLVNKKLPLLIFVDEIDKVANYHGSGGTKKGLEGIHTALLNYLDRQGARDLWLAGNLKMNGVWFVMTANTTDGINNTFLNRLDVVNLESPTAEEKKKIILRYFLNILKKHQLITSVNSYSVEKDSATGEISKYVIGDKDSKLKITIEDKILAGIIFATQETDGLRAPLRYMDSLWTKLYPQIIDNEKQKKTQDFYLDTHNINQYINLENIDTEVIRGKNIARCIYEALDGNHRFGHVAVMVVKNRSGEAISIIGDDQNHGMLFNSLGKLMNGLLSNLSTLVDSQYYSKFGLGIIKMETLNLILTMPSDAVKSAYTSDLVATIVVIMISVIRKIPLKDNLIIVGQLAPTGQFIKGSAGGDDKKDKIKYKNIIATITNNTSLCSLLILPASTKRDGEIQGYLKKLPKRVKVVYAANLGELLEQALDANQIS